MPENFLFLKTLPMKLSHRIFSSVTLILIVAAMMIYVMPNTAKEKIPFQKIRENLMTKKPNFGLDLVGGRQITYLVDLTEVKKRNNDDDPDNDRSESEVIDNIRDILRNRIDPQGTRELNIYASAYNEEKYVVVEITSDLDNEDTQEKLSAVIDLKFKVKGSQTPTPEEKTSLQENAGKFLADVNAENFSDKAKFQNGKEYALYTENKQYWKSALETSFDADAAAEIGNTEPGAIIPRVIERKMNTFLQDAQGSYTMVENIDYVVVKVEKREMADHEKTDPGEVFEDVQKETSERSDAIPLMTLEEAISSEAGSPPPSPEYDYPKLLSIMESFSDDSLVELNAGQISKVVENDTEFAIFKILAPKENEIEMRATGIYISKTTESAREKIDAIKTRLDPKTYTEKEEQVTLSELSFGFDLSGWKDTELGGMQFKRARAATDPTTSRPIVEILFNDEGAILFEKITEENVGKQVAIFVGGVLVSAPTVQEKISGGSAVITLGMSNFQEAQKEAVRLAKELNGGSTPAPFVEKGQYKIGSFLGSTALEKSLRAGFIGFLILSLWMILFYRFLGFIADLALGFYALTIFFLLQASIPFGWASILGIAVFMVSLKSFSTFEKSDFLSLFIAMILGIMVTFIAYSPIVLTLAGVSGIVLSIGMAVDANILIFERMKEEIRAGKNFSVSAQIGFERAWSSIRDSNLSSLITCMILWVFGSSVIKGFAVALAMGIVISMLTAITVTKTLIETLITPRFSKKKWLLLSHSEE